ncbi:MAG TPA: C2 family cysteine protease [Flavobacteriales bacterium]|nr:C2 family cysteine protease [Flavobacteriales bacterium]
MTEAKTLQDTIAEKTNSEADQYKGAMPGALTQASDATATILNNQNPTGISGNILSNYSDKKSGNVTFSGENPLSEIPDKDLIEMLNELYFFDTNLLTNYYYQPKVDCKYIDYDYLINYYEPLFLGTNPVTREHIVEFNKRIAGNVEAYKTKVGIESLNPIIEQLNTYLQDPTLPDRVKNDGDILLKRAKLANELNVSLEGINDNITEYNKISNKARFLYLTQPDVDKVIVFKTNAEAFIALYNTGDEGTKSCYADDKKRISDAIDSYTTFLATAHDVVNKSAQKIRDSGKNPLPAPDGSDYLIGKKEKNKDKPNKRALKNWGVYKQVKKEGDDKKTDEYSIYKKDKKEKDADEVDMNDAVQGSLGDCYLISSIAAVARRRPDLIKSLIAYKPGDSFATVTLYILDADTQKYEPKKITVSFDFPAKNGQPGYAKQGDNELWVMLIEKAYAQEMGGYANIESQSPAQALAVLTGTPPTQTGTEENNVAEQLKTANEVNYAVVAGTKEEGDIKPPYTIEKINGNPIVRLNTSKEKIYPKHAYTVLAYDETSNMIKLRNPHGNKTMQYYPGGTAMPGVEATEEEFPAEFSITLDEFKACFSAVYSSKLGE